MKLVLIPLVTLGTIAFFPTAPQASRSAFADSSTLIACKLPSDPPPKEPPGSY